MNYTVLLIVLPLLFGFLSMVFKSSKRSMLFISAMVNVALIFVLELGTYNIGGFAAPYGINLVLDNWSFIGLVLVNVMFLLSLFANSRRVGDHSPVLLTLLAGVNGMILTGDLFNLFVFIEITTISAYIMSIQSGKYIHTFNYLILGSVGSGLYLLGVILLYGSYGSLNILDISQQAAGNGSALLLPFLLMFVGLTVEVKLFPFNGWVKGIYQNANGLVGSVFASVVASAALFATGRIISTVFYASDLIRALILIVAAVTLISGEFSAFKGKTIREILLYSSVGQSGLVTLLLASGLAFPALLVLLNNAISKMVMFSVTDEISHEDKAYSSLKGAFNSHRILGVGFTTASFSLIGLPLFLGFYAKLNALIGLFEVNMLLPAVILAVTVIEGAYLIRLNIALWHPGHEGESVYELDRKEVSANSGVVAIVALLAIVIVFAGLRPDYLGNRIISNQTDPDLITSYMIDMKGGQ